MSESIVDELKAKGKSLDYIEGFIDGQGDMLKWAKKRILGNIDEAKR